MQEKRNPPDVDSSTPRLVAVIDIGASSLRMQIAEIHADCTIRKIASFSQAVSIGEDSFDDRMIDRSTIEDCVHVLKIYRQQLDEYGITEPEHIRVVATSGVREATNRVAFSDRVYIATGFEIEPFDEAELHRVTYLGILPFIERQSKFFTAENLVLEVGGGTTEVLLLEQADILFSYTYRLGAIRLRQAMDQVGGAPEKAREIIETQIAQVIHEFAQSTRHPKPRHLVSMGSEVRFAAKELGNQPNDNEFAEIKLNALHKLVDELFQYTPDQLAARYHLSLPDAKSMAPGILTQLMFARYFKVKRILVANSNLRDGLIQEMAYDRSWADSIQGQIVRSAVQLGRKFSFNESSAIHIAQIACWMFDELQSLHHLGTRFRRILELASLLHDIGNFISDKSRHKHSMHLIKHSDIFGIGSNDLELIALVARYHRGASPHPRHDGFARLNRRERVAVSKLAAILRLAKAFDVSNQQRIRKLELSINGNRLDFTTNDAADLTLEQIELRKVAGLFEELFGTEITLATADR